MWNLMPGELKQPLHTKDLILSLGASRRTDSTGSTESTHLTPTKKSQSLNTTNTRHSPPTSLGGFCSAHVLVNLERRRHDESLRPLRRSVELDGLAKEHAEQLAQEQVLRHSVKSLTELQDRLQAFHVGENVQRGASIRHMHLAAMQVEGGEDKNSDSIMADNILAPAFCEFGMGTAVASSSFLSNVGEHESNGGVQKQEFLYMVQLFRGDKNEPGTRKSQYFSC